MKPLIPYFDASSLKISENFSLKTPGIMIILGVIAGTYVAIRKAQHDDLHPELIFRVVPWLVIGIFIGGHLGHLLFYYPKKIISDPVNIFKVWDGLSSFGGFIMCTVLGIWFFRHEIRKMEYTKFKHLTPINVWAYADTIIYGFTFGWFFGRIGCFFSHDHPGVETNFWLGVYGICPSRSTDIACHDLGFYEAILSIVFFIFFNFLNRKPHFPGFFVGVLMVCYGLSRFLLDMLRHPELDVRYFGLTPAQYGSFALFVIGVWVLIARRHSLPVRYRNHR